LRARRSAVAAKRGPTSHPLCGSVEEDHQFGWRGENEAAPDEIRALLSMAAHFSVHTSFTMIPLSVPDLRGNEIVYLTRCVTDNWVSSAGPEVFAFEQKVAGIGGVAHGVATVNGTAALHLALIAAGVGAGDHVVVPDWTFAATANAVRHAGAQPVFVDVTRDSWTLDPALTLDLLSSERHGRIAAVIAVHALGHPADMDPLREACAANGAILIEDAAGAIGASYKGRPVGGLSDIAIFSFNGNKTITAGGGGMVVTDNADWAETAKARSVQARDGDAYRYTDVGFNYRLPNLNAALGLAQLERLDEMVAAKRSIAARYDRALADRDDLHLMPRQDWALSACWLYSVKCATPDDAGALVTHLRSSGIEARVFWEALSTQTPYASEAVERTGVADSLSGTVVSLPSSSGLSEVDQDQVIKALGGWRGRRVRMAA